MKVDLVAGVTPVPLDSVDGTTRELARIIAECRDGVADPGVPVAAREAAELVHAASAGLVAVVRQPKADPALLVGVLAATAAPLAGLADHVAAESDVDVRETVEGRTPLGYPVLFAERVVSAERLAAGEPFDCQLQAVVADPDRPRLAVFTLSSTTGRGWLAVSAVFGRLVASTDFGD